MKSRKKEKPNVIVGYNDKGEIEMYYWQKEPIYMKYTNSFFPFKIAWYKRNWLREFKWWITGNKTLTLNQLESFIKKLKENEKTK